MKDKKPKSRPLATDPTAPSANPAMPAFVTRPEGAPVYHGFPLTDVAVDGFRFGMITDFVAQATDYGDAYIEAPDGTRAGLVWEVGEPPRIEEILPPDEDRWGVWAVWFPHEMRTLADARTNLEAIVLLLKPKWEDARKK